MPLFSEFLKTARFEQSLKAITFACYLAKLREGGLVLIWLFVKAKAMRLHVQSQEKMALSPTRNASFTPKLKLMLE